MSVTLLNVSDKTVAALDRVRLQRGIRTRAKALEVVLSEALAIDEEVLTPTDTRRIKARLAKAQSEPKIPLSEIMTRLGIS